MGPLSVGILGMGIVSVILGAWFNHIAKGADPETKKRFSMPWGEALQPPPGTPSRLKPLGDWEHRNRINAIAYLVTMAKMAPFLWRFGLGASALGAVGLLASFLFEGSS